MGKHQPKRPTDLRQLRAIAVLEAEGFTRDEIMGVFGFSERTYFNRKAELRRIESEAIAKGQS